MISHDLEHESLNQGEPCIHQSNHHVLVPFSKIEIQPIGLQQGDNSTKCHVLLDRKKPISLFFNIQ